MVRETKRRKATALTDEAVPSSSGRRRPPRPRHGRKERPASRPADWRDWAALPGTALRAILGRLQSQTDVLRGTGLACMSWRRAAVEDPLLWRCIDLASDEDGDKDAPAGWRAMARAAVDRSAGRCKSFRGRVDGDFLADKAPLLRSLHVTSMLDFRGCQLGATAMEKLPLLEQLVVAGGYFDHAMLCAVVDHCPRLRLLLHLGSNGKKARSWLGARAGFRTSGCPAGRPSADAPAADKGLKSRQTNMMNDYLLQQTIPCFKF